MTKRWYWPISQRAPCIHGPQTQAPLIQVPPFWHSGSQRSWAARNKEIWKHEISIRRPYRWEVIGFLIVFWWSLTKYPTLNLTSPVLEAIRSSFIALIRAWMTFLSFRAFSAQSVLVKTGWLDRKKNHNSFNHKIIRG